MVNKFDRPVQKDWSWQTAQLKAPTLDYEMLNSIAAEKQAEYDNIASLNALVPNALQNPDDLAKQQEYRALVEQGTKATTDAYMKSASAGAMSYRDFKNQVQKAWQPGGSADMLNKRYQGYYAADKAIDEYYKDDTSPVNKTLAKQRLKEQAAQPTGWDPATGKYNVINTPELYKNPKINEAIDNMLKEIKANGDTTYLGDDAKSQFLTKIKTETRESERIKLAFQALSQQPEYAAQLQRDAQYKSMTIDPIKHEANYKQQQTEALATVESEVAKALAGTKDDVIGLQNLLRQNGYNINPDGDAGVLTKKAAQDFLDSQRKQTVENVQGYNFGNQMYNEVAKSYQNYATRGAYKIVDVTKTMNPVWAHLQDIAVKKEANRIAEWAAHAEFDPKDTPGVTGVSGLAIQLPDITTYSQELKTDFKTTTETLDKQLAKSQTFPGWKKEDVAEAYRLWDKVTGNTPQEQKESYRRLLEANSPNYTYTDDNITTLFEEMNGKANGLVKQSLDAYATAKADLDRVESVQSTVNSQFIKTPEGKELIRELRAQTPQFASLSDVELANKATSEPELFEVKGDKTPGMAPGYVEKRPDYNPATNYSTKRAAAMKKQQAAGMNYDWGSLNTYELYANMDNKILKHTFDGYAQALENSGGGNNFTTFGKAGVTYKKSNGDEVGWFDGMINKTKVDNMAFIENDKGKPALKFGVTITPSTGKPYTAYTEIEVISGSESKIYVEQLEKEYANAIKGGHMGNAQMILQNIGVLKGVDRRTNAAISNQGAKLNLNNTTRESGQIFLSSPTPVDPNGKQDITELGWGWKDLEITENINGYSQHLYGINTSSGNAYVNVGRDKDGNLMIIPSITQPGVNLYNSPDAARQDAEAKRILSRTPVEVTERKVHNQNP